MSIVMYGGGPVPESPIFPVPGFPDPIWPAAQPGLETCKICGGFKLVGTPCACRLVNPPIVPQHPRVVQLPPGEQRGDIVAGLAALLPKLKDALKGKGSLTADEAMALVWLEGVAAGHDPG